METDTLIGESETAQFCATADSRRGFGTTPREALDALLELMPNGVPAPIVIWPRNQGDVFFSDAQHARLQELKNRADSLAAQERHEWEHLVEASFDATVARTQNLPTAKS